MENSRTAKFGLGQIVRHVNNAFRGVIVDVDAAYSGTPGDTTPEQADRPFYKVFAIGADSGLMIYAAEAMLEVDADLARLPRGDEVQMFHVDARGRLAPRMHQIH
ncbi:heat shock protein HspQ [uncultured Brevundimonas sp.]|uniref:heat shock protein HspQ n=1 Tax=uncultured Brevundimonas sp. TaxID=213418 RepID=UPI0030EB536F|tara:strand:+ start:2008 stop:2322 length:315 start_codon:yes stop_codon:yes gene_type:complete